MSKWDTISEGTYAVWFAAAGCLPDGDGPEYVGTLERCEAEAERLTRERFLDQCDTYEVCEDCYFALHYGARLVDGQWFAGESDTPCDREPLALLPEDVTDLTDANDPYDTGIVGFSWSVCEGCGSPLGGARYLVGTYQGATHDTYAFTVSEYEDEDDDEEEVES